MATVQEEIKQYQWIKGDNFGVIVDVLSEDSDFINFTDGSKIFKTIRSEFLEEVIDGRIPLPGALNASALVSGNPLPTQPIVPPAITVVQNEPSVLGKMILKMSKKLINININ